LAGAGVWRSGGSTAGQGPCTAERAGDGARASGRWPRVGDKGAGGLRVRLKGKAGDLGGARSGKAGEDHGGRCAAGGERRKKGKKKGGADRWGRAIRERETARARWRAGGAGELGRAREEEVGRVEQAAGKEERAVASWAACGRRKGEWAAGKEAGPRRKRGAGRARLGSRVVFLFPSLFLFKPTQIYLNSNQIWIQTPMHSLK
jgi:hypothetical protein